MDNEKVKEIEKIGKDISGKMDNLNMHLTEKGKILNQVRSCIFNFWAIWISAILLIISVALNVSRIVIDEQNLVLGFIGAIATFIVISNYMQVHFAKQEFEKKAGGLQQKIDNFGNVEDKIEQAKKDIEIKSEAQFFVLNEAYEDLKKKIEDILTEKEAEMYIKFANDFRYAKNFKIAFSYYFDALKKYVSIGHKANIDNILIAMVELKKETKDEPFLIPSYQKEWMLNRFSDDYEKKILSELFCE